VNANRQASAFGASEIEIAAEPGAVWDVLTDFEGWPTWNPDVKAMSIDGDVASGTNFKWKSGAASITSTIQHVERPRLIAWTGRTFGISAIHVYRLEARGGGTVMHTEEWFEGWLARLLRGRMKKTLQNSLDSGSHHLKTRVEGSAR
jgi:uncharacterized protein YndB with AHSA1/START domain